MGFKTPPTLNGDVIRVVVEVVRERQDFVNFIKIMGSCSSNAVFTIIFGKSIQ